MTRQTMILQTGTKAVIYFGLMVTLTVFGLRTYFSIPLFEPAFFLTSGAEEESWYAIWKFVHNRPVYVDFHKLPFAASYFNWAFYVFYGGITKGCLQLFGLGDAWIPTIGRVLTLLGCGLGFWLSMRIAQKLVAPSRLSLVQVALLLFFFGGYLMGFWAVTIRPDVWALTLELAGLLCFLQYYQHKKTTALVMALVWFYLAWAFKQNFAGLFAGTVLFLLLEMRFRPAISLSVAFLLLAFLTYALGTEDYRYLLVTSQLRMKATLTLGLENLKLALVKSLPLVLFGGLLMLLLWRKKGFSGTGRTLASDSLLKLMWLCFAVSFVLFFLMAMKNGAADNYFFTPFIALCFALIRLLKTNENVADFQKRTVSIFAFVCLLNAVLGFLVITQKFGRITPATAEDRYKLAKTVMDTLPKPVFFGKDNLANIPWINKSPESFILATTYYYKDVYGDSFERGGVEGLMREGYFAAIVDESYPVPDFREKYILSDSVFKGEHRFFIWRKKK